MNIVRSRDRETCTTTKISAGTSLTASDQRSIVETGSRRRGCRYTSIFALGARIAGGLMHVGASVERERRPCLLGLRLHPAQGVRALARWAPAALSMIVYGADTIVFGPHTY